MILAVSQALHVHVVCDEDEIGPQHVPHMRVGGAALGCARLLAVLWDRELSRWLVLFAGFQIKTSVHISRALSHTL